MDFNSENTGLMFSPQPICMVYIINVINMYNLSEAMCILISCKNHV